MQWTEEGAATFGICSMWSVEPMGPIGPIGPKEHMRPHGVQGAHGAHKDHGAHAGGRRPAAAAAGRQKVTSNYKRA